MKKICPLCGIESEEDARFCKECNIPLYDLKKEEEEVKEKIRRKKMEEERKKTEENDKIEEEKQRETKEEQRNWIPDSNKKREKDNPFWSILDESQGIPIPVGLVETLTGKLEKAFSDNIATSEKVDVKLQPQVGQCIVVTDKKVMIIKAGLVGGAGFFGANCKSFYFNQITSVDLRLSLMGGHIQFTVAGSVDIKGKGLLDMPNSENAVVFTMDYKERMKYVANLIRERVHSSRNKSHINQNTSGTSLADQINELAKLKQQGILSEEEFQIAKRKLLS